MTPQERPIRVRLARSKGWQMPPNTVVVARPSMWGNPYSIEVYGRALALKLFDCSAHGGWSPANVERLDDDLAARTYRAHREWLETFGGNPGELARAILRGRNLACWCALDERCHSDIWLKIANES